jgi:hypothetical protein
MKAVVLFSFLAALPATLVAQAKVDYSGCVPDAPSPAYAREYNLTKDGRLVMPRGRDVVKTETTAAKDTLVTKLPGGVKGTQSFELIRSGGRPTSLVYTYPVFGGHHPNKGTITRNFKYQNGKCYLDEMTLLYSHGEDAGKVLVTYDHALCEELMEKVEGSKRQMAACSAEYRKLVDVMVKHDDAMRAKGKQLFGFDLKKVSEDPFYIGLNKLANCSMIRSSYPYQYRRPGGFRIFGLTVRPGEPVDRETGAQ